MLDVVSVMLSFISILVSVKTKKSSEAKIFEICTAMDKVDDIFTILRHAKQVHDCFEKFNKVGWERFYKSIKGKENQLTFDDMSDHIEEVVTHYNLFIKLPTFTKLKIASTNDLRDLPGNIRDNIDNIQKEYPILIDNSDSIKRHKDDLIDFPITKNYGNLTDCVRGLNDSTSEIYRTADTLIVNTVPVIDFIHYEIKNSLKSV